MAPRDAVDVLSRQSLLRDRLNRTLVEVTLQQEALTRLMLDLDGFEDTSDRLGHAAGDRLLQTVAEGLLSCLRSAVAARAHCDDIEVPTPSVSGSIPAVRPMPQFDALFAVADSVDSPTLARLMSKRIRLHRGDALFHAGSGFHALFAIRAGSCKTVLITKDGHEQVAGYFMAGEIIGMDGISTRTHGCQATALEDMEVCPLPFDEVERLARTNDSFRHNLHRLLSQDGVRAQNQLVVLGTMSADQRLATFLLDLSQRYRARGYSSCEFVLRMTRDEIGSYLGLSLETVSRVFSRLQRRGQLQVQGRTVRVLDPVALSRIVDYGA